MAKQPVKAGLVGILQKLIQSKFIQDDIMYNCYSGKLLKFHTFKSLPSFLIRIFQEKVKDMYLLEPNRKVKDKQHHA